MRVRRSVILTASLLAAASGSTIHAQIPTRLGRAVDVEPREVILFVAASKHRRWEIDRINPDGSGRVRLTGFGRGTFTATWSPDATQIAFGRGTHLFVMNANGTQRRQIAEGLLALGFGADDLAWSPDGSQIAFVTGPERRPYIAIANVDGSGSRRLTLGDEPSFAPAWSPDGSMIAFARLDEPLVDRIDQWPYGAIWMVGSDGSDPHEVARVDFTSPHHH